MPAEPPTEQKREHRKLVLETMVLLEGGLFLLMLSAWVDGGRLIFYPAGQVSPVLFAVVGGYAAAVVLGYLVPGWRGHRPGPFARNLLSLALVPVYLFMFSVHRGLALAGLAWCYLASQCLLPTAEGENGDGDYERLAFLASALFAGSTMLALLLSRGYGLPFGLVGETSARLFAALAVLALLALGTPALPARLPTVVEYLLSLLGLACLFHPDSRHAALPVLAAPLFLIALRGWEKRYGFDSLWQQLTRRPTHLLVYSFASVILLGTLVLTLPAATTSAKGLAPVDALFTATSATCVTGLIVVDTGTAFSTLGQIVILVLIQAGGLGIMTISIFVALALGRRIGLRSEFAVGEMIGEQRNRMTRRLLSFIVLATFAIELAGALVLAQGFRHYAGYGTARAMYYGIFHSISAFCNAGFALYPDSFVGFAHIPLFPLTLSLLITLGGLGFGVLYTLFRLPGGRQVNSGPHVRLVLLTSAILTLGGTLFLLLAEHGHTLAGMSFRDALVNAWFQSVTARTAGFNTVDLAHYSPASNLVTLLLMFVGAAPGSTGGGIKVTTLAVLFLLVRSILHGGQVQAFGRRIEDDTVMKSTALLCLSGLAVVVAAVLLLLTQDGPASDLLFETVSAFGTVGLSTGATGRLDGFGKLVIVGLMFVGRVGALSLLMLMRPRRRSNVEFPTARVMVG
ncbi:MAG: potassium transporter TrkG [Lentisphaeria bacterium]|jgi:trk system potassium uptake protein TrkH|nr:potassium transporter TrkG [Lentisphaeria bacterium]